MSYLDQGLQKMKADIWSDWNRFAMCGLMFLGICLMVMSSVSLAEDVKPKKEHVEVIHVTAEHPQVEKALHAEETVEVQQRMLPTGKRMIIAKKVQKEGVPRRGHKLPLFVDVREEEEVEVIRPRRQFIPSNDGHLNLTVRAEGWPKHPEKIHQFMEKELPECAKMFKGFSELSPPEAAHRSHEMLMRILELSRLKLENPKAFELEKNIITLDCKADMLAKEINELKDPAKKKEKIESLRKLLEESFQWRQKRRQLEAEAIAAELQKIQDFLKKREEHKQEIIQRHLDQLTGDRTFEW